MAHVPTFYELLRVDPDAGDDEIERAYRVRVKETHPDVADADGEAFKRVTAARDVLLDADARGRYDRLGHARYVHDNLNPENWPDVGPRPPSGSRRTGDPRRRRADSRRTRSRRRSRSRRSERRTRGDGRRRSPPGDDGRSSATSHAGKTGRRRDLGVRSSYVRARGPSRVHVSHSPQTNPYAPHPHDVTELAATVGRAVYYAGLSTLLIATLWLGTLALTSIAFV